MKPCDYCGRSPDACACQRIGLPCCSLCNRPGSSYTLAWIGKPNPFGAWRGEVFSHYECKDKARCEPVKAQI